MDRRAFIKLTAVTGTSTTLASCGNPEHAVIRFVPDDDPNPGLATWKPGVCPACAAGCGLTVRVMDGDVETVRDGQRGVMTHSLAKKLEGNPAHPVNQGRLCARGQAAIQLTYHPDRLTGPMKRSGPRGSGQFQPVSWDAAIAELVAALEPVLAAPRSLACLTSRGAGSRHDLWDAWLARLGAPPAVVVEAFCDDVLRRANLLSFGHEQLPTLDLPRARYVLSFGADFLGTWNSPVAQTIGYGQMRQGRPGIRGRFVHVEPRLSQTGANADEWVPSRPGTDGVLALGLAHVLLREHLRPADAAGRAGALIDGWSAGLSAYAPPDVERRTGVAAARIERIAREIADQRPAVAIIGGAPLAHTNGLFQALAVNALNALLGSVDQPGGVSFMPQAASAVTRRPADGRLAPWAAAVLGADPSPVHAVLLDGANPVFAAPTAWRVREALLKVPFLASFGSFIDDTSGLADLILPDSSFLESWTAARPESGAAVAVTTLASPVMRPLHDTRATPEVLLDVARRLGRALPWATFEEMLHADLAALGPAGDTDARWAAAKAQGGSWDAQKSPVDSSRHPAVAGRQPSGVSLKTDAQFDGDAAAYPFHFLPYPSPILHDGSLAHLPWLQEVPDPVSTAMWSSWVEVNPHTAARLQIAEGDIVDVRSAHGTLRAPALVSPGIAPDVLAMPVGQGHETFTRYASGRGANPLHLVAPLVEPETGALAWAATRVAITRVSGPDGRLILFSGSQIEGPDRDRGRG